MKALLLMCHLTAATCSYHEVVHIFPRVWSGLRMPLVFEAFRCIINSFPSKPLLQVHSSFVVMSISCLHKTKFEIILGESSFCQSWIKMGPTCRLVFAMDSEVDLE